MCLLACLSVRLIHLLLCRTVSMVHFNLHLFSFRDDDDVGAPSFRTHSHHHRHRHRQALDGMRLCVGRRSNFSLN